jgi:hypothetical protein
MDGRALLERRIVSANERLRAAQRDGRCSDIIAALKDRDELLDRYPRNPDRPPEEPA